MQLDFATMDRRTAYFWMASTITPRPVAWVSTMSGSGVTNLAPFSFFQMVTASPPTLMIVPQHNTDGSLKDTARNIGTSGEFVVNLVSHAMVEQMNATSFGFDADVSEFERCGVASAPSVRVRPPRVLSAPIAFECTVTSLMPYPPQRPTCAIILGEVVMAHADPSILDAQQQIDPARLDVVSRMGADWYGRTNAPTNFSLARPTGWAR